MPGVRKNHVGRKRNESAGYVGEGDGGGAGDGALRVRRFQSQFETHHEIDPLFGTMAQGFDHGLGLRFGEAVVFEELGDFGFLRFGDFDDLAFLAQFLLVVMLGVALGGRVAAQTHGDGSSRDFGESSDDDEAGGAYRAGPAGGKGAGGG